MEKEIQKMLYELTFDKPLAPNKENNFTMVQEMAKDNIKWLYYTFEKRNKKIKYFVILEAYKSK
jgi:hypothetical protein